MGPIVIGTDGSTGAEAAIAKVIELMRGTDVTVHLVCAYPGESALERLGMSAKHDTADLRGVAADVLGRGESKLREAGFSVEEHAREGEPAHIIMDVADAVNADLIVVGATGTSGLSRFIVGSVPGKLSHHASRSLLIVQGE